MRKFAFSALACVAFAGSSFASNEIVENSIFLDNEFSIENKNSELLDEDFKPCQVEFWIYDADGGVVDYIHRITDTPTKGDCYTFAGTIMREYELAFPQYTIGDEIIMY